MPKTRSHNRGVIVNPKTFSEARGSCCKSRLEATYKGHYDCFSPYKRRCPRGLFPCLDLALRHGNVGFAKRVYDDHRVDCDAFRRYCRGLDDRAALLFSINLDLNKDFGGLTAASWSAGCLSLVDDNGDLVGRRKAFQLAARFNGVGVVEYFLSLGWEWSPKVAGVAACAGNVRFLMRIFEAGCPIWSRARDGEPCLSCEEFIPSGEDRPVELEDWTLAVSSDLVRSGPVLLYAAQKGAPLTQRMEGMLGEVRRRALALAGCFHRAERLRRGRGSAARKKWDSMGRVPLDIVQRIATLARLSIIARDVVE